MMQAILVMLFLITSCGKPVTQLSFKLPADTASAAEREQINEGVSLIQAQLDENGVNTDVSRLKIVVAELEDPTVRGRCYHDERGRGFGIVLTKSVFAEGHGNADYLPWYLTVLLHEIGHCYFQRQHEDDILSPFMAELTFETKKANATTHDGLLLASLAPSVMNVNNSPLMLKSMFPYYVREIAGLERIQTWQDVGRIVRAQVKERP